MDAESGESLSLGPGVEAGGGVGEQHPGEAEPQAPQTC